MPQTVLALLAVMTASLFAMQQSRMTVQDQTMAVAAEVEAQATGVATEVFADAARLAFDNTTWDGGVVNSTSELSEKWTFGNNRDFDNVNDIDDLHNMQTYAIQRELFNPALGKSTTLDFEVDATVSYVELEQAGLDPDTGEPVYETVDVGTKKTFKKLLELQIRCTSLEGTPLQGRTVTLQKLFTYPPTYETIRLNG